MAKRQEKRKEETRKMTREEAGMRGEEVGMRGGEATRGTHGSVQVQVPRSILDSGEATEEMQGQESYQEMGKKGGTMPKGASSGEASEKGEVIVRLSGKDLNVTFSNQEDAEEWQNRFASMLEQEGYHLAREKPETTRSEAEAAAGE